MAIGLSAILTAVWNIKHYVPSVNNRSVRITRPRLRTDGTSSNNTNKDNESITDLVNETLLEDMLMKDESEASKPGDMSLEAIESIDDTTEITPSDSIPSISPSSPRRSWCVISNKSMWPSVDSWGWRKSVPHSAEALLPCWSWFVETNSTTNCGFYVMDNLKEPHSWARQLMDNMGCKVKYSNFSSSWNMTTTSLLEQEDEVKVWREFPFQECYWFKNQKHVRILKELVLLNDDGQNLDIMSLSSQLNIGLVNRTGTRQIENLSALRDGIEDALKEQGAVSISIQLLDSLTLQQQAKWFASQHIIIATHGAALANCIFIQPNTTVISLYPLNYYFVGYFESLIEKAGGVNMDWYAGDKTKARDVHTAMTKNERERAKKVKSFNVSVEDITALVVESAERYSTGNEKAVQQ